MRSYLGLYGPGLVEVVVVLIRFFKAMALGKTWKLE